MSYPDDERNPWKSLAELLSNKMDVVALASAIEAKGIFTWDRFGRMIDATEGVANDLYSKARALNLLALVNKKSNAAERDIDSGVGYVAMHELEGFIEDYDGPLVEFGWPLDECPDFETYKPEHSVPRTVSQKPAAFENSKSSGPNSTGIATQAGSDAVSAPLEQVWIKTAREIGKELVNKHKNLNLEHIAEKVHVRMAQEKADGKPCMTGRGGIIPSAATIKRHALMGIRGAEGHKRHRKPPSWQ